MTHRLYYDDPALLEFDATVVAVREHDGRRAVVLDRSAFYPTSGGQIFDTGVLLADGRELPVAAVEESPDETEVLHLIEGDLAPQTKVHGRVDAARRRDHRQQHTGQHVLSAAFEELFGAKTVSFHMGDDTCTIDLETKSLTPAQLEAAERRANEVVFDDRPVAIRYATPAEAEQQGVRKLPPLKGANDKLRLIAIRDFDLNACGGTHVSSTGEIGVILLRKMEKVKQGVRVEFVCGERARRIARKDYAALTDAASLLSAHIHELPQQIRKLLDDVKAADKSRQNILEDLAALHAERLLHETPEANGRRIVVKTYPERDATFIKFLAHQLIAAGQPFVALLGAAQGQPTLVFAQKGTAVNAGALMKEVLATVNARGGGNAELAQGGVKTPAELDQVLHLAASKI